MQSPSPFHLHRTDARARRVQLTTAHGVIETPAFMPVGTRGTVKAVPHRDLLELEAQVVLGNTYHLLLRPGIEVWDSWFDLAADGTVDLPDAQAAHAVLVGGGASGAINVTAAGAVEVLYTSTGGVTAPGSGAGTITVEDGGTACTITNNSGSTMRLVVRYLGAQL